MLFRSEKAALFDESFNWRGVLRPKWLAPLGLFVAALVVYLVPGSADWPQRVASLWPAPAASAAAAASEPEVSGSDLPPQPVGVPVDLAAPPASGPEAAGASEVLPNGARPLTLDSNEGAGAAQAVSSSASAVVPVSPQATGNAAAASVPTGSATPQSGVGNALLSMRARESTWVEVRDGQGNRVLGRLIQRDEVVDLSVAPPLKLRVGNAPALTLSYKGQAVDLTPFTRNNVARFELP